MIKISKYGKFKLALNNQSFKLNKSIGVVNIK